MQALNPKDSVVLFVEDNPDDSVLVANALHRFGVKKVYIAETGEDAMQVLEKKHCDVVLTDYNLPGMSGLRLLESIREARPEIPIIVVTGVGDEGVAVSVMKLGVSDYITKDELLTSGIVRSLQTTIRKLQASQDEGLRSGLVPGADCLDDASREARWLLESVSSRAASEEHEAGLGTRAGEPPVDILAADSFLRSPSHAERDHSDLLRRFSDFLHASFREFPNVSLTEEDDLIRMLMELSVSPDHLLMMYKACLSSLAAADVTPPMNPGLYLTHLLVRLLEDHQRALSMRALDQAG